VLAINHDFHQTSLPQPSAVWAVAESCWNHAYDRSSSVSCAKNSVNISLTYLPELIVSTQNVGPIIRLAFTAHHTPTFTSWRGTSWINRTLVPIILGGNILCKLNHTSSEKRSQTRVNFSVTNWLQKQVAEINPASRVTWLQIVNYSLLERSKFEQLRRFGCSRLRNAGFLCKASQWFLWCVF
jgi:hypothetical protein